MDRGYFTSSVSTLLYPTSLFRPRTKPPTFSSVDYELHVPLCRQAQRVLVALLLLQSCSCLAKNQATYFSHCGKVSKTLGRFRSHGQQL